MCRQVHHRSGVPFETDLDGIRMVVTRKPIKNLYLRVKPPDGHLEISAPQRMSMETIAKFVVSRRSWIDEMHQRVVSAANEAAGANMGEGFGGAGNGGDAEDSSDFTGTTGRSQAQKWTPERREDAKRRMNAQLDELLPRWTAVVGRAPSAISLRPMTTRWGSCTPRTRRIRLNLELADMPDRFLEYVLVHELTHLWASGHGAEFQRLMTQYLPNWRVVRHDLNKYVIF